MQPEPKRSAKTVIVVVLLAMSSLCLCGVLILGAILFPVFAQAREKARVTTCMSNLKQLGLAMQMYLADYDDRFPAAAVWGDMLTPYAHDQKPFRCPSVPEGKFGYAMNSDLSRKALEKIAQPQQVPMLYDSTNLEWNAHDAFASLPDPPRHRNYGNTVAYADGRTRRVGGTAP